MNLRERDSMKNHSFSRRSSELFKCEEKRESESLRLGKTNYGESVNESLLLGSRASDADDGSKGKSKSLISEEWNPSTEIVASSGRYMKEVSINLGLGFSLAYLMAASKRAFNKMIELQTQMETLIKDFKGNYQRKDVNSEPSLSNNYHGLSHEIYPVFENTNPNPTIQNCVSSHHLVETEIAVKFDQHSESGSLKGEECAVGIEQLEAELQTELERLQLSLDGEDSSKQQHQQYIEMVGENTSPVGHHGLSFEEVDNLQEADCVKRGGVSPNELERRLHEILEARQQEQITELESALECANRKLCQKEMEVSLWKDSAKLISILIAKAKCLSRRSRRRHENQKKSSINRDKDQGNPIRISIEDEEDQRGRLLQRYLQDQLDLVVRSVYFNCENDESVDVDFHDETTTLLS